MYGIKDGRYGLFPSDFVERMSPQAIRREMRVITKVTRSSYRDQYQTYNEANNNNVDPNIDSDNYEEQGNTWDSNRLMPRTDEDGLSEVSASAGK